MDRILFSVLRGNLVVLYSLDVRDNTILIICFYRDSRTLFYIILTQYNSSKKRVYFGTPIILDVVLPPVVCSLP